MKMSQSGIASIIFTSVLWNICAVQAGVGQRSLLAGMFKNYQVLERPVKNDSEKVLIKMHFYLRQVMDINEKHQIMRSSIWLNMLWRDERLKWNPRHYRNVSKIIIPFNKIWSPDILLWNSATQQFDATYKANVEVSSNGEISWVPPALFTSTCSIDITWFPFDLQACTLKFSSWTYEYRRLDLDIIEEEVDTSNYQLNGEWDLEAAYSKRNLVTYECCPNDAWVDVTVTIKLRRRVLYYMFNIIIPSVVISCIGLLTFALPCESGEKVTMSVTILLSLAFFMTMVAETLPSTSEAIPFLGIYFGSLMLLCAISLVVTVFVGSVHHRKPSISPIPDWIHKWFSCRFAVFFRMLPPDHPIITSRSYLTLDDAENRDFNESDNESVSLRYRKKDAGNNSGSVTPRLNSNRNSINDAKSVTVATSNEDNSPIVMPTNWLCSYKNTPRISYSPEKNQFGANYKNMKKNRKDNNESHLIKANSIMFIDDANKILEGLKEITSFIAETTRLEEIRREWRLAAAVVDRIFMYISLALFLVFNFLMALLAPNTPLSIISIN